MISADKFARCVAGRKTHVPLIKKCDHFDGLGTPVDVYSKVANCPYSYLLESVEGGIHWGRYSIVGLACTRLVKTYGKVVEVWSQNKLENRLESADPLAWIEAYFASFKVADDAEYDLRFSGGLVGYFGYETVRHIESRLAQPRVPDELGTPDILLLESHELIVIDNWHHAFYIVVHAATNVENAYAEGCKRIDEIEALLHVPAPDEISQPTSIGTFTSGFGEEAFKRSVADVRRYIVDGDVMQMVLSQRLSAEFLAPALSLYSELRVLNPSPYMYYFDFDDFHVVGASPEVLVRVEGGTVTVRPIAGTRPRGETAEEDKTLRESLLSDEKELAEHLMLIDLGRNDLGRVCKTGSVKVTEQMLIEQYSHVMHIVSKVVGQRREDVSEMDILRACFPAGTVSGAPKVRALELIDEMEPVQRGVYSGAIGYLSWSRNLDTAIAIRTAIVKDNILYVQAGAGLVYDSSPEREWHETLNKANAILQAAKNVAKN